MGKRVLILCTGNSCRSQMAEGILRSLDSDLEIYSAGTKPASKVNPNAIKAMDEIGIDISDQKPNDVNEFTGQPFDYVITVCDNANETCPAFSGKVKKRLHISFTDPVEAEGDEEEILEEYRSVRDEINNSFNQFYYSELQEKEKVS